MGGRGQRGQRARQARNRGAIQARPPRAGARAVALAGACARIAQGDPRGARRTAGRRFAAGGHRPRHAAGDRGGRGARLPRPHAPGARGSAAAGGGAADRRGTHGGGTSEHRPARLRARARAIRAEHLQRRPAPLLRAERRLVSLLQRAAALDDPRAPLRRELLRTPGRPHRQPAGDGGADEQPLPRRVPARARRRSRCRGDGAHLHGARRAPASHGGRPRAAPGALHATVDRRRPAHAHRPLRRLRHARGGAPGERTRAGSGRDRGDRPQRDLWGTGSQGAGSHGRREGDRRRGGQDSLRGRGDRAVHQREDPPRTDAQGDDRRDQAPGGNRVRAPSLRPHALGARLREPAEGARRSGRDRGVQPARGDQRVQRRGRPLRRQVPRDRRGRVRLPRRAGARLGAHPHA